MSKTKLFQYVIFFEPTEKEEEEGKKTLLVKDVTNVLATEEKNVVMIASRAIPEEYLNKLDQINIIVRPF
jgi:hypothetical protein